MPADLPPPAWENDPILETPHGKHTVALYVRVNSKRYCSVCVRSLHFLSQQARAKEGFCYFNPGLTTYVFFPFLLHPDQLWEFPAPRGLKVTNAQHKSLTPNHGSRQKDIFNTFGFCKGSEQIKPFSNHPQQQLLSLKTWKKQADKKAQHLARLTYNTIWKSREKC